MPETVWVLWNTVRTGFCLLQCHAVLLKSPMMKSIPSREMIAPPMTKLLVAMLALRHLVLDVDAHEVNILAMRRNRVRA